MTGRKMAVCLAAVGLLGLWASGAVVRPALEKASHVRTMDTLALTPEEGFLIGNGDLSCSVWRPSPKDDGSAWKKDDYNWFAYPGITYFDRISSVRHNGFCPDRDYPRYRDALKRWVHPNGLVTAMSAAQWARAGWTESFACVAPFQDMLLQSWDGAIRIFPRWKTDIDVGFRDFRAEGAFLVSASLEKGAVTRFRVKSLKGADCLVHGDWTVTDADGKAVATDRDEFGRLRFKTTAGGAYRLAAAK